LFSRQVFSRKARHTAGVPTPAPFILPEGRDRARVCVGVPAPGGMFIGTVALILAAWVARTGAWVLVRRRAGAS
jgi:hypothetical protein